MHAHQNTASPLRGPPQVPGRAQSVGAAENEQKASQELRWTQSQPPFNNANEMQKPKTFGDIQVWCRKAEARPHPAVKLGLADSTRKEHEAAIRKLSDAQGLANFPIVDGILEYLMRRRKQGRLKWATVLKYAGTIAGALKLLPMYRQGTATVLLQNGSKHVEVSRPRPTRNTQQHQKRQPAIR